MKLIMLGAPGAGKGTLSAILSDTLNIPTISTGNILRAAVRNGTPVGLQAKSYMEAGKLVPDEIIISIVAERLEEADCANGYILDGVPRTIAQAEALEKAGILFDHVLSLEIPDETIAGRVVGRRFCEQCGSSFHIVHIPPKKEGICDKCGGVLVQREDDRPDTVEHRLEIYHIQTEPLKEFYSERGILYPVDVTGTVEENTKAMLKAVKV